MRFRLKSALALLVVLAGLLVWGQGWFGDLTVWAAEWQREVQNSMARGLRALRAGEPGALLALLGVCFSYGFFHAVGPGHGKVLIGGYTMGGQAPLGRMSIVALLSSLAQGATAILLVYAGVGLLNLTRTQMVEVTEDVFAKLSYGAIALIGIWLVWRGLRKLLRSSGVAGDHGHVHQDRDHAHDEVCPDCGHRHGPDLEEVAQAGSIRELAVLVAGIAIRPCTGALFLLVLTWRMDLVWQGVFGVVAMSLGTATVTIATAVLATGMRSALVAVLLTGGGGFAARALPILELLVGAIVVMAALALLGWL